MVFIRSFLDGLVSWGLGFLVTKYLARSNFKEKRFILWSWSIMVGKVWCQEWLEAVEQEGCWLCYTANEKAEGSGSIRSRPGLQRSRPDSQ